MAKRGKTDQSGAGGGGVLKRTKSEKRESRGREVSVLGCTREQ